MRGFRGGNPPNQGLEGRVAPPMFQKKRATVISFGKKQKIIEKKTFKLNSVFCESVLHNLQSRFF
jgi:hypothetical protein